MSTGSAPLHLLPLQGAEHPSNAGSTDTQQAVRDAALPCHLAKLRFGATAAFLFETADLIAPRGTTQTLSEDIFRTQAKVLASYATTLPSGLAIDDIYAHPLVRRVDILHRHRMRTFIAAPVLGADNKATAVLCAADTNARCWQAADLADMQQIVAQTGALHLSQF